MLKRWINNLSYTRTIAFSFLIVILVGSVLLSFPFSSKEGVWTPYLDALFTSTSATCVTGLVVYDTYTYWSPIGQLVILLMIQIGGIGLMTIISMFAIFTKKKIGLHERMILMQSSGNMRISGIVKLVRRIIIGTCIFEGVGTIILAFRFIPRMGLWEGLYNGVFHSISAFCNAGFDIMGKYQKFSSFTGYETDAVVSITLIMLIVIGGIGFLVWNDILKFKWKLREYSLHSKIVLVTTPALILIGCVGYYLFEFNGNLSSLSVPKKILSSAFMSVTTRTAGFNTMDVSALSESGNILTMVLMFIGGSPGSTAGGIKTTTLAILILAAISMSKGRCDVTVFKKRLEESLVKQASVITFIYIGGILLATMMICWYEKMSATTVMFETISAAGTVGLSTGITPDLGAFSRIILIVLMYGGRIGGLSLLLVFSEKKTEAPLKRPSEKIMIG
jgi:trk system potassium uptake protein TrkH